MLQSICIDAEGEGFASKSNGYGFVNFETKELLENLYKNEIEEYLKEARFQ